MEETPIFRAAKRRKVLSKSIAEDDAADLDFGSGSPVVVKRQLGAKRTGTKFSSTTAISHAPEEEFEVARNTIQDGHPPGGLQSRFIGAGSSARVTNSDMYMTDFIDRAMAEKSTPNVTSTHEQMESSDEYTSTSEAEDASIPAQGCDSLSKRPVPQPLSEVDLGLKSKYSNLARTAAALNGQLIHEPEAKKLRRKKPRLGRDGKPFRPRSRKGPSTDDITRSALVDQVLHEHGLGTYDNDGSQTRVRGTGVDEAADERMAAEFQQQFLETVAERQQRQAQGARVKKETSTSDGPRLGGSRSARAKMAAIQSVVTSEKK